MKKLKLSKFDLGVVIAFVVITLIGIGAWWYLSGALSDAQGEVASAKADFDKYSSNPQYHVVVSMNNLTTTQTNISLIQAQLVPVIQAQFQSKDNKLSQVRQEDPVAWKHDLDDEVHRLNVAAKAKSVTVPPNYYFGFSRYLNASPSDEQTPVLTKQLLGIEQIANVLISAQVRSITAIRRSYEEDPHAGSNNNSAASGEEGPDHLGTYALTAAGGTYVAYPFEVDFETSPENFRTVVDNLIQSPYVFIIRSLSVKNSIPNSPMINSLDQMAGTPPSSVIDTSPGEVASTTSTRGPQYLFGNATLQVKARIDMIEWTGTISTTADNTGKGGAKSAKGGS